MQNSAKTISLNTIFLYIRMVVLMILSFFSSRILLDAFGVVDYGIYSLVCSLTTVFLSLRSLFSESIQRFISIEKGNNDKKAEKEVFTLGLFSHIILAIIFLLLIETIGVHLVKMKLNIPLERLDVAIKVFQCTIFSSVFTIITVPFDALVIANERMNFYAITSIIDISGKLLVICILSTFNVDRLYLYVLITSGFSLLLLLANILYCRRFPECKIELSIDKSRIKEVVGFAGWSFAGNMTYTLYHEGVNLILNIFGGVTINAARNIAYQVRAAVNQIANNTILATRPKLIQDSVVMSNDTLLDKVNLISRLSFYIMLLTITPIFIFTEFLLNFWLVEVPNYSIVFTRLILISVLFRTLHGPLNLFYMAKGKIARMVSIESILLFSVLILSYCVLLFTSDICTVFILQIILELLIIVVLSYNLVKEFVVSYSSYYVNTLKPVLKSILIFSILVLLFSLIPYYSFLSVVVSFIFLFIIQLGIIYYIADKEDRKIIKMVYKYIMSKFN